MLERIAYGMGDFGGNLIYTAISSFLLVYYVSVVGIPAAAAGSILAISKIFDGVSDLIMGRIVDKSNSKRGKALPWLIRMSIPMGICSVLMFTIPAKLRPHREDHLRLSSPITWSPPSSTPATTCPMPRCRAS
jgi:Na+/melibiose symporter and related transporters